MLELERDLFLRLLELGQKEDLRGLLVEALALVVEVTGAAHGYLELAAGGGEAARPPFWIARGLPDAEIAAVRAELSTGIIAEALRTGRTISTASAVDDPRFAGQASVLAQRIRAVLCAPVGGARPIGVLYLQGRSVPGPFPEQACAHAELFARHLGPIAERLLEREEAASGQDHTAELRSRLRIEGVAGKSRALAEVLRQLAVAAPVGLPVLLLGESGTGKTALARALHASSPRAAGPFVELNCAAIPETLFESELFGAEKGAHSAATRAMPGKVEAAEGGTLLLDEVGEMPLAVQAKLLGFLQNRRYYRLGGTTPLVADVRVVAATNADLAARVADKSFREDLYYRLDVIENRVPALRERPEDVPAIADAVLAGLARTGDRALPLSRAGKVALAEAEWPGNVRQLENVLARGWAAALAEAAPADGSGHLFPGRPAPSDELLGYQEEMRRFQARLLGKTLDECGGNVSEAARRLGLSRSHLHDLIRALGLSRS